MSGKVRIAVSADASRGVREKGQPFITACAAAQESAYRRGGMHLESGVKVDFIVRKSAEFRQVEFERRQSVAIAGIRTWVVSCEDLILSKIVWALESNSELQRRDIQQLLVGSVDLDYIRKWAQLLRVTTLLDELLQ